MAQPGQEDHSTVAVNSIIDLLAALLSPDWTIEGLAEPLLGIVAA
jgi:hypothetical protein